MQFPIQNLNGVGRNNTVEQHKAGAWFPCFTCYLTSPAVLCWKCSGGSRIDVNRLGRVKSPTHCRQLTCVSGRLSLCCQKWVFSFQVRPPPLVATVCCRRSSRGRLCRAGRHSPSAERSRRTVRPPWFCFWPTSPWTGSPTPRPGPGLRWTTPPFRSPGPPCSPPRSLGPFRTWEEHTHTRHAEHENLELNTTTWIIALIRVEGNLTSCHQLY